MKVVILSTGADTNGQGWRIREAFGRHAPEWEVRSVSASDNYLQHPRDAKWDFHNVDRMVREADIIHCKNDFTPFHYEGAHGKPFVVHHHGTKFRESPGYALNEADRLGALTVVSTIDLILRPDVRWLPAPTEVARLSQLRHELHEPSESVRIVHTPTNRRVKDTDLFLAVVERLKRTHRVEGLVFEGRTYEETLRLKARHADILYDQLKHTYGNNSLEAFAMGVPAVSGGKDESIKRMRHMLGSLPFVLAERESLYERMRELVECEELRREYGQRGYDYVVKHHDYPAVVKRLVTLYGEAVAKRRNRPVLKAAVIPRGTTQRFPDGSWRRVVRDGMWASVPPEEAARLEADHRLGVPVTVGVSVAEALAG